MTRLLIEIEPDPDGVHCGDLCRCNDDGMWCGAFDDELLGPLSALKRLPECLAAEQAAKRLEAYRAGVVELRAAALAQEQMREFGPEVTHHRGEWHVQHGPPCDALKAALEQLDEEAT
ncbi:MAG: hypothetical protein WC998_05940 [Candidatus Paceibacterota bacterium]|jgi:hypothetical protein